MNVKKGKVSATAPDRVGVPGSGPPPQAGTRTLKTTHVNAELLRVVKLIGVHRGLNIDEVWDLAEPALRQIYDECLADPKGGRA